MSFRHRPDVFVILYYTNPSCIFLYNSEPCFLFFKPWIALFCLKIEMCRLVLILKVQPGVLPCVDKLRLIYITSCDYSELFVVSGSNYAKFIEYLQCCKKNLWAASEHLNVECTLMKINQLSVYCCNCCSHFIQT